MGIAIVKLRDRYVEWSTVVDAPISWGMTLDELRGYVAREYGAEGLRQLPLRLERVEAFGTSMYGVTLDDILEDNRAGDDESCLDEDGLYEKFCARRPAEEGERS